MAVLAVTLPVYVPGAKPAGFTVTEIDAGAVPLVGATDSHPPPAVVATDSENPTEACEPPAERETDLVCGAEFNEPEKLKLLGSTNTWPWPFCLYSFEVASAPVPDEIVTVADRLAEVGFACADRVACPDVDVEVEGETESQSADERITEGQKSEPPDGLDQEIAADSAAARKYPLANVSTIVKVTSVQPRVCDCRMIFPAPRKRIRIDATQESETKRGDTGLQLERLRPKLPEGTSGT
jgi:hypothetical protein